MINFKTFNVLSWIENCLIGMMRQFPSEISSDIEDIGY